MGANETAVISFGLVNIPTRIHTTVDRSGDISFNMLHDKCKGRLKQHMFCPVDNEIVPRDQMVKGYEYEKDKYVVFSSEEIKSIENESSKTISILEFISMEAVDPIYLDSAYFLTPDKGAEKAYKLLMTALNSTGMVALAEHSTRGKTYPVLLRPGDNTIIMHRLVCGDEIKDIPSSKTDDVDISTAEIALAMQIIGSMITQSFNPNKFKNRRKESMREMVEKKIKGEDIAIIKPIQPAPISDLMEMLKASLGRSND